VAWVIKIQPRQGTPRGLLASCVPRA
jgi:hypothetical protein